MKFPRFSALFVLGALAFGQAPATNAPPPPTQVPTTPPPQDTRLWTGAVEAPAQPNTQSSATYGRGPRFEPRPGRGAGRAITATIETVVDVRGQEENTVTGIGLVTGLAGTGDSVNMTRQLMQNMLLSANIRSELQQLTPKNCAIVAVEATLPPGLQPGRRIDVRVSTLGDAKSLQGGLLSNMELRDFNGVVWALGSGSINVGGFMAAGASASVQKNQVTVGTIIGGGTVQRALPSELVSEHGLIYLDLRAAQSSYANLVRICDAVNTIFPNAAEAATDGRTVKLRVPADLPKSAHVAYLDAVLRLEIEPSLQPFVVVNERTGAIVIGDGVRLRSGAIALGGLTVTIAESPETSQPGPMSNGQTQTNPRTEINVDEAANGLVMVPGAVTLDEVVEVLNVLGTTPRDLIQILEAMHQAGILLAEVRRM
jgi:flagellar P-ring protein precursor FlgI